MQEELKPSEKLKKSIFDGAEITDSLGRKIKLRSFDLLDIYDLNKASGSGDNEKNSQMEYNSMYFSSIDGFLLVNPPTNNKELRANLKRIGFQGFAALGQFVIDNDASLSNDEEIEEIKK